MKGYGENFKQRVIDSFKKEPEIQSQFGGLNDIQIVVPKITFSDRLDIVRRPPDDLDMRVHVEHAGVRAFRLVTVVVLLVDADGLVGALAAEGT